MAVSAAQRLKDDGIIVISLGLSTDKDGSNINKNQLKYVASSQSHVVVTSYPSDDSQTNKLISLICSGKKRNVIRMSQLNVYFFNPMPGMNTSCKIMGWSFFKSNITTSGRFSD